MASPTVTTRLANSRVGAWTMAKSATSTLTPTLPPSSPPTRPGAGSLTIPLLTCKQSIAFENALFHGNEQRAELAMNQAGRAVGLHLARDVKFLLSESSGSSTTHTEGSPCPVTLVVLLGKGNNAGDALIAAKEFADQVIQFSPPQMRYISLVLLNCFPGSTLSPAVERAMQRLKKCSSIVRCREVDITPLPPAEGGSEKKATEEEEYEHVLNLVERAILSGANSPSAEDPSTSSSSSTLPPFLRISNFEPGVESGVFGPSAPRATGVTITLDGIFGMQFRAPFRGVTGYVCKSINSMRRRGLIDFCAAVDLPSGLGEPSNDGPTNGLTFEADVTYATAILKQPLMDERFLMNTGRVRMLDCGFFDDSTLALLEEEEKDATIPAAAEAKSSKEDCRGQHRPKSSWKLEVVSPALFDRCRRAVRTVDSDKRFFGKVYLFAGTSSMPGAALMSTRATLLAGAGLVTVLTSPEVVQCGAGALPEAMWSVAPPATFSEFVENTVPTALKTATSILIGPGLAAGDARILEFVVQWVEMHFSSSGSTPPALLLDASALQTSFIKAMISRRRQILLKKKQQQQSDQQQHQQHPFRLVMTPHAGELKRICEALDDADATPPASTGEEESGFHHLPPSVRLAQRLSRELGGAVIVCKGPRTWIVSTEGDDEEDDEASSAAILVPFGGPMLARGGSGDILAGLIAGSIGGALKTTATTSSNNLSNSSNKVMKKKELLFDVVYGATLFAHAADELARVHGERHVRTTDLMGHL